MLVKLNVNQKNNWFYNNLHFLQTDSLYLYNVKFNKSIYDLIHKMTSNVRKSINICTEEFFTTEQKEEIEQKLRNFDKSYVSHFVFKYVSSLSIGKHTVKLYSLVQHV